MNGKTKHVPNIQRDNVLIRKLTIWTGPFSIANCDSHYQKYQLFGVNIQVLEGKNTMNHGDVPVTTSGVNEIKDTLW